MEIISIVAQFVGGAIPLIIESVTASAERKKEIASQLRNTMNDTRMEIDGLESALAANDEIARAAKDAKL